MLYQRWVKKDYLPSQIRFVISVKRLKEPDVQHCFCSEEMASRTEPKTIFLKF